MLKSTPDHTEKLIRDLKVGDIIHCEDFDLISDTCSHVTITEINPYGTSFHSLIISGEYFWQGDLHRQGYVFDKLSKVRIMG